MNPENIKEANELVKELTHVQEKLSIIVGERDRLLCRTDGNENSCLSMHIEYTYFSVDKERMQEVLQIIIAYYSVQKAEFLEKIEAL